MKNKVKLYNYIFHYNPYTQKWNAVTRENKEKYFNGELDKKQLKEHSQLKELLKIVTNSKDE